jgi:tetratricopeptide (TPR) repeat protein
MARDWDLLASFFVPLMVFSVYALGQLPSTLSGRTALGTAAVCALLHCAGWIGVNASEEKHLQRVEMLHDARLLSPTTFLWYDEALANFFFDTKQYERARVRYEHYISIDPDNLRIIGNISDVYRKVGDKEKYFAMLREAVRLNTQDPGIYSNLGVEFAGRGDTTNAIQYNEKALSLNPRQVQAHANLGILYASRRQFVKAIDHFIAAIDLGMRDPPVYRYAADLSLLMGDYSRALRYYDSYLSYRPTDQRAITNRKRATDALARLTSPPSAPPLR